MSDSLPEDRNEVCVGPTSEKAGKADSCAGCPNQKACLSGEARKQKAETLSQADKIARRLESVSHVLLVLSGKGGVGKSTVSTQLALTLSKWGLQVGICDLDICGPSVAKMTGSEDLEVRRVSGGACWAPVYASERLAVMSVAFLLRSRKDAVIWRGPRKSSLIAQFLSDVEWGALDILIVDLPPGTSDEHLTITQLLSAASERVSSIIVSTPQEMSLLDVRKEINFCERTKLNVLGVIENMTMFRCPKCAHCTQVFPADTGGVRGMCEEMDVPFVGGLPLDPILLRCSSNGLCFVSEMCSIIASEEIDKPLRLTRTDTLDAFVDLTLNVVRMIGNDRLIERTNEGKLEFESGVRTSIIGSTIGKSGGEDDDEVLPPIDDDSIMMGAE